MTYDWRDAANCRGTDTEEFYPEKGESTRYAKKLCSRCEVREDCLQAAIDARELHGVWGGMSPREREVLMPPAPPRTHCRRGHSFDVPGNARTDQDGHRRCIVCDRGRRREVA